MSWQRFVGRRDNTWNVLSDNESKFLGAQKELSNWLMRLDKCALQDRLLPSGTQWHFHPPYSSHRGGVWERLIRSGPDDETLSTFLVDAERILNNRPLVPVTSDDLQEPAPTLYNLVLLRFNEIIEMVKAIGGCYTSGLELPDLAVLEALDKRVPASPSSPKGVVA
ncbi:unnamed protein product [Echinostoma caproni]|uniref:Integrase catalytic domain-containing protein n=1 Tax=Echinostoma caproni TaxID=27848 RepID=A0A183B490_9TREM|nr:unnamed protein product [Echinostoma caproni]